MKIAEFRNNLKSAANLIGHKWDGCICDTERLENMRSCLYRFGLLADMKCPRATAADLAEQERMANKFFDHCMANEEIWIKARSYNILEHQGVDYLTIMNKLNDSNAEMLRMTVIGPHARKSI